MSTLSRVAENLYWLGRYIERAECTARLLEAESIWTQQTNLGAEMPRDWGAVLQVSGVRKLFDKVHKSVNERNVREFMILSPKNPSSLVSSITFARQGARTIRDVMSREAWEHLNSSYREVSAWKKNEVLQGAAYPWTSRVRLLCQQQVGVVEGTISRHEGYQFLLLGRNVERADMTTRLLDYNSVSGGSSEGLLDDARWRSVLRTLSAYQMYRITMQAQVTGSDVKRFLIQDEEFPRSVRRCLERCARCLQALPHSRPVVTEVRHFVRSLQKTRVERYAPAKLHAYLDRLQVGVAGIHNAIAQAYFLRDVGQSPG